MATEGHRAEEMIELQTTVRALEVEVIGRYVANPAALNRIRLALARAFDALASLKSETLALAAAGDCPAGYIHRTTCVCMPYAAATDGDLEQERKTALDALAEEP
ncbi:MAG TPA: hypothetical protein VMV46_04040 [Thermoanaerobaculia bacterium]|nr:hypothetical protein [Thermoanaerobaculia bacterium]